VARLAVDLVRLVPGFALVGLVPAVGVVVVVVVGWASVPAA